MIPRHATDVISLVAGTIFAGFTAVWILTLNGSIEGDRAWIGGPIIMITAGAVGLAAALRPQRPQRTQGAVGSTDAASPAPAQDPPETSTQDQAAGRPD